MFVCFTHGANVQDVDQIRHHLFRDLFSAFLLIYRTAALKVVYMVNIFCVKIVVLLQMTGYG